LNTTRRPHSEAGARGTAPLGFLPLSIGTSKANISPELCIDPSTVREAKPSHDERATGGYDGIIDATVKIRSTIDARD
jgi:hypothetical protein